MLTWLRELAATVGTFDRSALEPGYALRCTIGVAIPLVIAAMLGQPSLGVAAAIGAFITGFTSLQGIYRTRLLAILSRGARHGGDQLHRRIGGAFQHWTHRGDGGRRLRMRNDRSDSAQPRRRSRSTHSSRSCCSRANRWRRRPRCSNRRSCWAAVSSKQFSFCSRRPRSGSTAERSALADVYHDLAEYARGLAVGSPAMPPITPFATARQVLADPQPFARVAERARLDRLLEDSEVIRRRLGALATTREVPKGVGDLLDAITGVLRGTLKPEAIEVPEISGELGVNLRDAVLAASMLSSGRLPNLHLLSKPRPGPYVENRIDWRGPDSLRSALVMSVRDAPRTPFRGRPRLLDSSDRRDRAAARLSDDIRARFRPHRRNLDRRGRRGVRAEARARPRGSPGGRS